MAVKMTRKHTRSTTAKKGLKAKPVVGKRIDVLHADAADFDVQLTRAFKRNVKKARAENKRLLGSLAVAIKAG